METKTTWARKVLPNLSKTKTERKTADQASAAVDVKRGTGDRRKFNIINRRPHVDQKVESRQDIEQFSSHVENDARNRLKVIVLGGLEEVGRNMTVMEFNDDIIIIDMGMQFPDEDMPGIDYVIPNISYLKGKEKNIKGVIITHGHMDHIGAVPHLMPKLGNPLMYAGRLSAGLMNKRQEEYRDAPKLNIQIVLDGYRARMGNSFQVEFFKINHSIPDSFGLAIKTPVGQIIHTGDYKFDHTPVNDTPADLSKIAQYGSSGVLALMSDSTNAEHPGHQLSEKDIGIDIDKIFEMAEGRIIIGTFASMISRIQLIVDIAEKHGRRILLEGRSMKDNVEIAHKLGYLKFRPNTLINSYEEVKSLPDNKVVVVGTGAQGQQNAFLTRFASGDHRFLAVAPSDLVVFSSSVIPGNERTIQALNDTFYRKGAKVINYQMMDVHAGGHAKAEDAKLMINLIKPKYFIPIEAYHYMLRIHADHAHSIGIPRSNIMVADNGQIMEFYKQGDETIGKLTNKKVPTDYVMVDGLGVGDVSNIVLRDRRMMSEDGMVVIIATLRHKTGELVGNPDIISRGFVYMKESKELIEQTRKKAKKILQDSDKKSPTFEAYTKDKIRNDIGQFLFSKTKRRPMVLPVIIQV
ncbi:MAG: ribonuclease J [bacterium]